MVASTSKYKFITWVSGHLGTEHMRHLGTRYWTSRYCVSYKQNKQQTNVLLPIIKAEQLT